MSDVGSTRNFKHKGDFARAFASEKHEREARKSLQDIIIFNQAIEKAMQKMLDDAAKGLTYDSDLYKRMSGLNGRYKHLMTGFLELGDNDKRQILITFADEVQDLMKYIHLRRNA